MSSALELAPGRPRPVLDPVVHSGVMEGDEGELSLLERLRSGDPAVVEALMEEYASRVYRLAYGITRNQSDAEEVVQDVFLTICRKGESFEGRSTLGSWIVAEVGSACVIETSLEAQLPRYKEDGHREGDRLYVLADWSQNPEADLLSGEVRAILNRAIDGLPDHYRAVLILRDVEELSNEEIAQTVGESVASVKSRLHRARMALREQLTRHLGPRA